MLDIVIGFQQIVYHQKNFLKHINYKLIILVIISPIVIQNLYQLNKNFIGEYQSNLSGFFGLNEINNFLHKEKADENDLVFFDFKRQSPINIQRLNNYNDEYNFEFFSYFQSYFNDLNQINTFLEKGNIYVIKSVNSKISKILTLVMIFYLNQALIY